MTKKKINRRKFLGTASCATIGYTTLFSSLLNLKVLNAAAMDSISGMLDPEYKALVCFSLSGGNDSFNMLAPYDQVAYNEYNDTRTNLAIDRNDLLPITPHNQGGKTFGLHPSLSSLQQLFNDDKLSFVSNIGTLIAPITRQEFFNETKDVPLGLFSHADQYQQWQTGLPHERAAIGWGGRVADMVRDMNNNNRISMNISLSGTNVFQRGNNITEYTLDSDGGSEGIYGHGEEFDWSLFNQERTKALDSFMQHQYQDVFKKTYVDVVKNAQDAHLEFQAALEDIPSLDDIFSDTYLSEQMKMIARTIAAHEELDVKRQVFYVDYGGWDHHDEVLNSQTFMLNEVAQAMSEFNTAMEILNMQNQVSTFSISEFGRTLTSNGNGTDHAWGGNVMVMGGAVNGGNIYGDYPSLAMNSPLTLYNGILVPQISTDSYFAELALWFGVPESELLNIFPNLGNFYSPGSGNPLGFLNY